MTRSFTVVESDASRCSDASTFSRARSAASDDPASSSPTTARSAAFPARALTLRATLAAPPGRSSVRFTCTTGTGASGEMRLTSPNQ